MDVDDYIKIEKEDKAIEEEKAKEWTLSEKIKEAEKEMPDITDINSGIHAGHWTIDDIDMAVSKERIKALKECRDEVLKAINQWSNQIKYEEEGSGFEQYYDLRIDQLKEKLGLTNSEDKS